MASFKGFMQTLAESCRAKFTDTYGLSFSIRFGFNTTPESVVFCRRNDLFPQELLDIFFPFLSYGTKLMSLEESKLVGEVILI